jgi:diguanylate cyclase (GGDEF)-like protein
MDPKAEPIVNIEHDLRTQIAYTLRQRCDWIVNDAVPMLTSSGFEALDAAYCRRTSQVLVLLLASSVSKGELDSNDEALVDLRRVTLERSVSLAQLFRFTYAIERAVLEELALDKSVGAPSEPWPLVVQLVRRASFDLLSTCSERIQLEPQASTFVDSLTALHTRPLFETVLAKELARAARTGQPASLILFDVDHLSRVNEEFGRGVGDQILERVGFLMRKYFREHDWVARYSEDSIAVLLPATSVHAATELAESVRHTVEDRLEFTDHRAGRQVSVTVSAAVADAMALTGGVADSDWVMAELEAILRRAKLLGRNRVEKGDRPANAESAAPST